jgi:DNA-binding transcriptional MerR regulator
MYTIGQFSEASKTTIKALRYYDEIGLFKPAYINQENGYRFYTTDQLFKLHKIISLKQIGLSIQEISEILSGNNVYEVLNKRKKEIQEEIVNNTKRLSKIINLINEEKEGFDMEYQAIIKDLPECIVYSKRLVVPSYDSYFEVIPAIGEEVKSANPTLKCRVPGYCFIVYHDGEFKEKDIDMEYCEAVDAFGNETETIKFKKISKVTAVSVMHKGPYKELRKAYAYIFKWIEQNGYTCIDKPRECYIDGIWNKDDESEWLTEIQVPIKK